MMSSITQNRMKKIFLIILIWATALPSISQASFVRIGTALGDINIELFDTVAPNTVTNFMNYVNDGDYVNSFFHRSIPGFVLQGGGFNYDSGAGWGYVPVDAPVANEFNLSNLRGTLAMAKVGSDPDSATSQWFFNLANNSANLDVQNGGFTVFGQVIGNGMDVVDAISALTTYDITKTHPAFTDVPLNGYEGTFDPASQLVRMNSVTVVPVPAAVWLFGSGLMGLIAAARRSEPKEMGA